MHLQSLTVILTYSHRPVDTQMEWDQDEVVEEEVDSFGPALNSSVSSSLPARSPPKLGEEEGAKRVDF